jgi:DNA-binding MarR family transcriptional regulator
MEQVSKKQATQKRGKTMILDSFKAGIELFRNEVFNELPLQQMYMLLLVMDNEVINQQDFQDLISMPAGSVSRNLAKLGSKIVEDRDGNMVDVGYGLIQIYPDPTDPKKNTVHLTKKGKEFADKLKLVLSNRDYPQPR